MEYTNQQKSQIIYNWKKWGVLGNMEELFKYYSECENCEFCNIKFKNTFEKCLDHDHITLNFRKVVCRRCNNNDNYIKLMNGEILYGRENKKEYDKQNYQKIKEKKKEQQKIYREKNKELIKEKESKIIICECGCEITRNKLNRHKQTKKHIKLMEEKNITFD